VTLFNDWCDFERSENNTKRLWKLREREGGRDAIADALPEIVRSHYDDLQRIAEDVRALGFAGAAAILAERIPRTSRARSGELGEILATELIEEETDYGVPIRRLRYKDGREMSLRGDDFLGVHVDDEGRLHLLKGESKSRAALAKATITEARKALSRDDGRPTATTLLFVADRLLEGNDEQSEKGRLIRNEVATRTIPADRIDHVFFSFSGNATPDALAEDLDNAGNDRTHTVM
jgi:hypothetical protein